MRANLAKVKGPWTEARIARTLIHSKIFNRGVLAVPNTNWTGYETDLLVVTKDLRLVDVEIKISRADLKADAKKTKWWVTRPWSRRHVAPLQREWPDQVWKHYYCLPAELWSPELEGFIRPCSGILLLTPTGVYVQRRAKPNPGAKSIGAADAIDIARLAGLRMWDALL